MRRRLKAVLVSLALGGLCAAFVPAGAADAAGWSSAQPPAPAPPEGQAGVGVPVPLGHIGQISFWAPNRGLLITAGTKAVPAGLYYYNGVSWRELSTVCGGADGRIAWAGPDDFWTISDMQSGQESGGGGSSEEHGLDRSLCHFVDGHVVASYAEPIGVAVSYQPMHAAACAGPSDCWFGGDRLPGGVNPGAFHLHWNGTAMTALPSPQTPEPQLEDPAQSVASMAFYRGHLYESVKLEGVAEGESPSQQYFIHRIVEGSSKPFLPMLVEGPPGEAFAYAAGEPPFQLSASSQALWAAGGSAVLRLGPEGQFQQLRLSDPTGALAEAQIAAIAAEPGREDALVSVDPTGGPEGGSGGSEHALARVARIDAEGTVEPIEELPQAGEPLGHKGAAAAIACPAAGDCWVATVQGWLFHQGGDYPEDRDPSFDGLIDYRPPDASVAFLAPESYPEDDSGANPPPLPAISQTPPHETTPMVRAPLFSHVTERLIGRSTLALGFTLATRSRVRLVAQRKRSTVARTASFVLARGRHTLKLKLRRAAWPTKLDLQVHALGPLPLVSAGSSNGHEAIGGPTAVET